MKIVAIIYLLGFITAWFPVLALVLVNMTPLTKIALEKKIDLFGYAARATLTGFWVMVFSGLALVSIAVTEAVKYFIA